MDCHALHFGMQCSARWASRELDSEKRDHLANSGRAPA
jgi:hypothetical protein